MAGCRDRGGAARFDEDAAPFSPPPHRSPPLAVAIVSRAAQPQMRVSAGSRSGTGAAERSPLLPPSVWFEPTMGIPRHDGLFDADDFGAGAER